MDWAARQMVALTAASLLANPARLSAQDPWPVLDRASAAYQRARTFAADFVQVVANPMVGEPDTTHGRLYQQRPNRFAMRFTQPRGDRIVADGRWLWLYTPSTTPGQVIRSRIPENGTTGPNLIGQFVERPRERYRARYVRADSSGTGWMDVIALTPRDSSLPYSGAVVWVRRGDGLVHRLEITESGGQLRVVILSNLEENAAVAAREFRFTPPASVQVVEQ
jgi:outer membrane lipoprotein carrier protein